LTKAPIGVLAVVAWLGEPRGLGLECIVGFHLDQLTRNALAGDPVFRRLPLGVVSLIRQGHLAPSQEQVAVVPCLDSRF
jgi:hypothetical protein